MALNVTEQCAGVLIWRKVNNRTEFFVVSPGGPFWTKRESWNIPKGHREGNESDFECAIREFCEETGVQLSVDTSKYTDLGIVKQSSSKIVHIYSKQWEDEKLDNSCFSNTFEMYGKQFPEIGKYAWLTIEEIKSRGGVKSFYSIFENIN